MQITKAIESFNDFLKAYREKELSSSLLKPVDYILSIGGLHIIDVNEPKNPKFVSCYYEDGYTHDAQCVVYQGPDTEFQGQEICFNYNEDTVTIIDVTDKKHIKQISRTSYERHFYTHQVNW